jgi:chitodextrinase
MKRILLGLGLPLLAFVLFLSPALSFAWQNGDIIYVDNNATGNGSGTSWANAFTSIKEAVLSVPPGTQVNIFVTQGVYFENHIILTEGIKLYGSFAGDESSLAERRDVWDNDHWTVIDAERKHRVLNMKDKTEVNGFILRNGLRDYTLQSGTTIDDSRGGGIYIECDDDVVVRNNIIEHCAVYWQGGGIFIEGSRNNTSAAPLIEFNVIRSCTGYCGGGIEIAGVPEGAPGGTDAIIRHNVLRNNPDGGTSELGFGLELWTEYDDRCSPRMGDFYNNIIIGFHNKRDWNIDAADVWVWARNSADRSFISQEWYLGDYLYSGCYKFGNPNKQNIFGSDPMFVDEANSNYRLRDGSPCIGTGRGGVNIGLFPDNRDTQAPVISSVASTNITSTGATISWSTNEPADTQVEYGTTTTYGNLSPLNSTLTQSHSVTLSGLGANTTYHYRVKSKDAAGNPAVSGDSIFTTAQAPDAQAPTVPGGLTATAVSSTQINLSWTASADNVGVTGYRIYRDGNQITTTPATSYQDTGRLPSTMYTYGVAAYDAAGNVSAQSGQVSITTPTPLDTQPPVISSVASSGVTSSGATLSWSTNEPADTQVEYGTTITYGNLSPLNSALTQSHSVTLSGLGANTTYHYRVKSKDAAGNPGVSGDYTFTTATSSVRGQLRLVKNNYAYPGEGWDNAIDGDTQGWDGTVTASDNPPYAIFAFADNSIKSVSKIRLMTDTGVGFRSRWVTQFSVQVSTTDTNASSFIPLVNKAAKNGGAWQEYPLTPTQAKYIKLILDQPSSGWRQIGEFEVYVSQ